ncbi:MAG: Cna B-type domain-containing protein [Erysipelotrichaceae bacterium]|nr:Cna B-type domain-containing protein [Erysipelotrichaceae bacterium]
MSLSILSLGKTVYAADDSFDVSGSKTAEPTELDSSNRETTITLSLPSAEYQNEIDIVFAMDSSSSAHNSAVFLESANSLFDSILANNPNLKLKVGVIRFRGSAHDAIDYLSEGTYKELVEYNEDTKDYINKALNMSESDIKAAFGNGSSTHAGIDIADEWLAADEELADDHKYLVLLTDGKTYIWNNEKNEPTTIYTQYFSTNKYAIQNDGKPALNQSVGYNKTVYQVDVLDPKGFSNVFGFTDYAELYASTNEELTGVGPWDAFCNYASDKTQVPSGTVTIHDVTNGTELFGAGGTYGNRAGLQKYYEFTPDEAWKDVPYQEANPFAVIKNDDGTYTFDTETINPNYFLYHADCLQKGMYMAGHLWSDVNEKYNCAVITYSGGGATGFVELRNSFISWLQDNSMYGADITKSEEVQSLFTGIDNSIRYMVSKGVVTDKITDEFTLKNADTKDGFRMTLSGEALAAIFQDGKWYFGEAVEGVYPYEVTYDAENKTITWTINVPVENSNPVALSYDLIINEDAESNFYDTNVSAVLDYKSTDGTKDGTYTFEKPKVSYIKFIDIPVEKSWVDGDDQDGKRPEIITVNLMNGAEKVQTAEISERTEWKATFKQVPDSKIVEDKMEKITYKVEEEAVEGYEAEITGSAAEGFKVENTHEPEKTDITVVKKWEDNENGNETRPSAITVNLLADGESVETVRLSENDEWQYTFEGMPKYSKGNEITYTVTEEPVEAYETSVKDFVITNTALYTITYKLNGGEFEGKTEDIIEIYPANTVISIHKAPTRKGYTFLLWEGSEYQPNDEYTVTGDHTFTAQWKKDEAPNTGDNSNLLLWTSIFTVSVAGIASVLVFDRKRRVSK